MGELKTHKDLDVWKESIDLAKNMYKLTGQFPKEELYNLTSQIRRCYTETLKDWTRQRCRG